MGLLIQFGGSGTDQQSLLPDDLFTYNLVHYGGIASAQSTPDMTVNVTAGAALFSNAPVSFPATTVTIGAADATRDRVDLVTVTPAGVVQVEPGELNDGLAALAPSTTNVPLYEVYVMNQGRTDYTGTVVDDALTDARTLGLIHTSPYKVSGLWYGPTLPSLTTGQFDNSNNNNMYLVPFFTAKELTIQAIGIMVNVAAGAGAKARLGVYQDDGAGGLSLALDAGQVPIDVATAQSVTGLSLTLAPGFWWRALAFQSFTGSTCRLYTENVGGFSPIGASSLFNVCSSPYGAMKFSGISGALPTTPSGPDYSALSFPAIGIQAA